MSDRGTVAWMKEVYGPACKVKLITIPLYATGPRIEINELCREAFLAQGFIFQKHGYLVRIAGCYNCRPNTTDPHIPSNHSWGTADDINPDTNPYSPKHINKLITDMPEDMVNEIESIKTKSGVKVFRWGGRYKTVKDAMHFEIIATPDELATGIDVGVGIIEEPTTWPTIRIGSNNTKAVKKLQQLLTEQEMRLKVDGIFGLSTHTVLMNYQQHHGLVIDGVAGPATWTSLLNNIPPIHETGVSPTKGMA